jgi:nitroreductase
MSFLNLVNKRYSVRNYKDTPVAQETIDRCIEAVRLAPSACNSQPYTFVIVNDPDLKNKLAKAAFEGLVNFNHFAYKAPVLVLIVSERQKFSAKIGGLLKRKNFSLMDIGIAAEHFCLQAAEEGLGTCMLGWFNEKRVKKLLSISLLKRIELMISVGYSADKEIPHKDRKGTDEIASSRGGDQGSKS